MIKSTPAEGEDRRDFMKRCLATIAGATVAGTVLPLLSACEPSQPIAPKKLVDTTTTDPNGPAGTPFDVSALTSDATVLDSGRQGADGADILLVRLSSSQYLALSMLCTHQQCPLDKHVPAGGPIHCSCHGSDFNLDGSVLVGPATHPLKHYPSTYVAATNKLYVEIS